MVLGKTYQCTGCVYLFHILYIYSISYIFIYVYIGPYICRPIILSLLQRRPSCTHIYIYMHKWMIKKEIHIYDLSEYMCINICMFPIGAIHEVFFSRRTHLLSLSSAHLSL